MYVLPFLLKAQGCKGNKLVLPFLGGWPLKLSGDILLRLFKSIYE
jgi:hypothetical protein